MYKVAAVFHTFYIITMSKKEWDIRKRNRTSHLMHKAVSFPPTISETLSLCLSLWYMKPLRRFRRELSNWKSKVLRLSPCTLDFRVILLTVVRCEMLMTAVMSYMFILNVTNNLTLARFCEVMVWYLTLQEKWIKLPFGHKQCLHYTFVISGAIYMSIASLYSIFSSLIWE